MKFDFGFIINFYVPAMLMGLMFFGFIFGLGYGITFDAGFTIGLFFGWYIWNYWGGESL
jgi:hypothetical protein